MNQEKTAATVETESKKSSEFSIKSLMETTPQKTFTASLSSDSSARGSAPPTNQMLFQLALSSLQETLLGSLRHSSGLYGHGHPAYGVGVLPTALPGYVNPMGFGITRSRPSQMGDQPNYSWMMGHAQKRHHSHTLPHPGKSAY